MKLDRLLTVLLWLCACMPVMGQTVFTTAAPGNWSSASTWSGGVVPTGSSTADSISINHNVLLDVDRTSMNARFNISASATLTVNVGRRMSRSSNRPFTIGGNLVVNGRFSNSGATNYAQGIQGLPGSSISVAGIYETVSCLGTEGSLTVQPGGRINGGGNVTVKGGFTNNGYVNVTTPLFLYNNAVNNDTLRVSMLYLEGCQFANTTRAFINNGTHLYLNDTSTLVNTDSSYINSFGRITLSQGSTFIIEDSARLRTTNPLTVGDSSTFIITTKGNYLCQSPVAISAASSFTNNAIFDNVGNTTTINGRFENGPLGLVFSNGTLIVNGLLLNQGELNCAPGSITVNAIGLFNNEAAATCSVTTNFTISGTVNNRGALTTGANAVNLNAGGTFTNHNLAMLDWAGGSGTINGTFNRSATDTIKNFTNVRGTGTFNGNFEPARLDPATATTTGLFTINGNYNMVGANDGPSINVNGPLASTDYDRIVVNGQLGLGGTLYTAFNYTPVGDTALTIIRSTGLSGSFDSFSPALPTGWSIVYNIPATGDVTLVYAAGTVPLRLLDFGGSVLNGQTIALNWQTADESNTDRFELEWGQDGSRFERVYTANARNTNGIHRYAFDHQPTGTLHFYRLKMVGRDGQFRYSPIIRLERNQLAPIKLYPNPASDVVTLSLPRQQRASVQIINAKGQVVQQQWADAQVQTLSVAALPPGRYWVKVWWADASATMPLLKY
jgi:hypothetical protein